MQRFDRAGEDDEPSAELRERLRALEARVAALEHRGPPVVDDAGRMDPSRLAVLDGSGFERIVLEAGPDHAVLLLRGRPHRDGSSAVALYAHDAVDGERPQVGVALAHGGELVAIFEADGRRAAWWRAWPSVRGAFGAALGRRRRRPQAPSTTRSS